jgi:chlorobactene glucosyltransferase
MLSYWLGLIAIAGLLHLFDIRRILQTEQLTPIRAIPNTRPLISVLIPARDEAGRIQSCLAGLAQQSYREFEVIVIDDHSTDDTARLAAAYRDQLPQLKIFPGKALPHGWAGKNWACWQAAEHARGEWLLFLDADVIPSPDLLATLATHAKNHDVISLVPFMLLGTTTERLILPAFLELLSAIYPYKAVNSQHSALTFAIGQCLMFRRSAYDAIGGHRFVRESILEDMQLATRTKQAQLRLFVAEAPDLIAVRMYTGWRSLLEGLTKNAAAGARHGGRRVAVVAVQRLALGWVPFNLLLWSWFAQAPLSTDMWLTGIVLLVFGSFVAGWTVRRRFRIDAIWGVLLPFGTLAYFLIAARGFIRLWFGLGVRWKGRVIGAKG